MGKDLALSKFQNWGLPELFERHPRLRILPSKEHGLILRGEVEFNLQGPKHAPINDAYKIEIRVPVDFPKRQPTVLEIDGRIPDTFHKLEGGYLCLASPTALRAGLTLSPTISAFVDDFVVPYLFGYSYFALHNVMPFGELAHGKAGILQYLGNLFGCSNADEPQEFLRVASMKKRVANKAPCPCRSSLRLGKCHHRHVNAIRRRMGRSWLLSEYRRVKRSVST